MIKEYIENDKLNRAIKSLKVVQKGLPKAVQNEISQLISIHNDITQKERMGTESELILYPMRNKLSFEILNLVDKF